MPTLTLTHREHDVLEQPDVQKVTLTETSTLRSWAAATMRALIVAGAMIGSMAESPVASASPPTTEKKEQRFPVENPEKAEKLSATLIEKYLGNNVERSLLLRDMRPTIEEFRALAPNFVLRKCMDGRLQGPNAKGCPETIIYFGRTHGAIADIRPDNYELWNPINQSMILSSEERPALFIVTGHTSCAAHKKPDEAVDQTNRRAQQVVQDQAYDVARAAKLAGNEKKLVVFAGMTDTDNLGMTLYRPNGTEFYDAQRVIKTGNLKKPASIFDSDFLRRKIDEDYAHECIKGKTMAELLGGDEPPAFGHGQETIALEAYLLRRLTDGTKDGSLKKQPMFTDFLQEHVDKGMGKDFPAAMRPFMTHMLAWNTANALNRNRYLERLKPDPKAYANETGHSERVLALGNSGFDTLRRNEVVLIKPGSFDDRRAIAIGADVLEDVYTRNKPGHYPLVHINIELEGPIETRHELLVVLGRMRTKANVIRTVLGDEARIFTTYSYHHTVKGPLTKAFYPANALPDNPRLICPRDVLKDLNVAEFDPKVLRQRETDYVESWKKAEKAK